jgi:glycosyltransferase involved in cell wall biosynthesis
MIAIVTHTKVVSHLITAHRILQAFRSRRPNVTAKVYDFEDAKIPEKNVLYVGTLYHASLSYLSRFLPEKRVVMYATCEGFPIIDAEGVEKKIAQEITIVPVSGFVKMCLETVGLAPVDPVYHGLDMSQTVTDTDFSAWVRKQMKGPIVLCVSGNTERKGLDRFIIASKIAYELSGTPEPWFILHSGEGYVKIPSMIQDLEVKNFWYTNSFGMYTEEKVNSLYDLCSFVVQPSFCEGFGLPMIEAQRFNKPTVAVNAQPYNEIVEDGKTGRLIPVRSVERLKYMDRFMFPMHTYSVNDLADAIVDLLSNSEYLNEMSSNIAVAKRQFELDNYCKLLDFF